MSTTSITLLPHPSAGRSGGIWPACGVVRKGDLTGTWFLNSPNPNKASRFWSVIRLTLVAALSRWPPVCLFSIDIVNQDVTSGSIQRVITHRGKHNIHDPNIVFVEPRIHGILKIRGISSTE